MFSQSVLSGSLQEHVKFKYIGEVTKRYSEFINGTSVHLESNGNDLIYINYILGIYVIKDHILYLENEEYEDLTLNDYLKTIPLSDLMNPQERDEKIKLYKSTNMLEVRREQIHFFKKILSIFVKNELDFTNPNNNRDRKPIYSIPEPSHIYWETVRKPLFREKYLEYLSRRHEFLGPNRDLGFYLRNYLNMSKSEIRKHQYLDYLKPYYNEF